MTYEDRKRLRMRIHAACPVLRGDVRVDGSYIGYDYDRQQWIDTSPTATRDPSAPLGSARNPLSSVPRTREESEIEYRERIEMDG